MSLAFFVTAELLLNSGNLSLSQERKTKKNLKKSVHIHYSNTFFYKGTRIYFNQYQPKQVFVAQKQKKENILIINLYNILLFMFTT